MGYLTAVSRKLPKPFSGQIMARSAAGKSSLIESILDFLPPEDMHEVTAMTGQSLYYLPADGLQHKVLAMVEDEGSEQANYPLKILQSEHALVLAVTVRDPEGRDAADEDEAGEGAGGAVHHPPARRRIMSWPTATWC